MRVGTMFLGRVEPVDNESIQTKFFVLGVPLLPLSTFYATSETGNGVTGIEIPVHGLSVLAGYLRSGLAVAALLTGVFAYVEHRSYSPRYGQFLVAGVLVSAWLLATIFLGRLSEQEKERRRLLKRVTGLGAPPEILPPDYRQRVAAELEKSWLAHHPDSDWRAALASEQMMDVEDRAHLYVLCTYAGSEQEQRAADRIMSFAA